MNRLTLEMSFSGKWQTKTKPIPMKWQPQKPNTKPIFILPKNTNIKPNFNIERSQNADKIPRKYQEIWDRKTKYRFGFGIFLVYQIFGYRLTSLIDSLRRPDEKQPDHKITIVIVATYSSGARPEASKCLCPGSKRVELVPFYGGWCVQRRLPERVAAGTNTEPGGGLQRATCRYRADVGSDSNSTEVG